MEEIHHRKFSTKVYREYDLLVMGGGVNGVTLRVSLRRFRLVKKYGRTVQELGIAYNVIEGVDMDGMTPSKRQE
jgi:hypothetical protein